MPSGSRSTRRLWSGWRCWPPGDSVVSTRERGSTAGSARWPSVFGAVAGSTGGKTVDIAVNLAYPVADLILLGAVVAILVAARGFRHGTWWWLSAAMLTFVVTDSLYLYEVAAGSYVPGSLLDQGWPVAIVLMAWAAWQPVPATEAPSTVRVGGITTPLSLAGVALALMVYDHFERANLLAVGLASLSVLVALVRLAATHRESRRHLAISNHHAVTDALTGLGNRRLLLEQAARHCCCSSTWTASRTTTTASAIPPGTRC
jgi:hypothetical protein